jgi:sugar/nucleoside kinase (ribokinase family)
MTFGIGGSESSVAIGVRRLGHPATWIGRLGDDPPGHLIARELRAERVSAVTVTDRVSGDWEGMPDRRALAPLEATEPVIR